MDLVEGTRSRDRPANRAFLAWWALRLESWLMEYLGVWQTHSLLCPLVVDLEESRSHDRLANRAILA